MESQLDKLSFSCRNVWVQVGDLVAIKLNTECTGIICLDVFKVYDMSAWHLSSHGTLWVRGGGMLDT